MDRFSETELFTALMALRAIAYQAENDKEHYSQYPEDHDLDQGEVNLCDECLDAVIPAINWIQKQLDSKREIRWLDKDRKLHELWLEMKKYKES